MPRPLAVLPCLLLPLLLQAEEPADPGLLKTLAGRAQEELRGSSVTLGAGYIQGTFKATKAGTPGNAQLTDNGKANLLLDYQGREKALARVPMKNGAFLLGWNLTATAGQFTADRQLVNSAFTGTNLGTSVKGQYAAVAPSLFLRMGPLYPGTEIYWSFGAGLGVAAAKYQGTAQFGGSAGPVLNASPGGGVKPALFETAFWQLDLGHWVVVFNSKYFLIRDANFSSTSYEVYGLSAGYRITF